MGKEENIDLAKVLRKAANMQMRLMGKRLWTGQIDIDNVKKAQIDWIAALLYGAQSIGRVETLEREKKELEDRLAQVEREREAAVECIADVYVEIIKPGCDVIDAGNKIRNASYHICEYFQKWGGLCQKSSKEKTHNPEACKYFTTKCNSGAGCIGTKEIFPCEGEKCKRWKPKEKSE